MWPKTEKTEEKVEIDPLDKLDKWRLASEESFLENLHGDLSESEISTNESESENESEIGSENEESNDMEIEQIGGKESNEISGFKAVDPHDHALVFPSKYKPCKSLKNFQPNEDEEDLNFKVEENNTKLALTLSKSKRKLAESDHLLEDQESGPPAKKLKKEFSSFQPNTDVTTKAFKKDVNSLAKSFSGKRNNFVKLKLKKGYKRSKPIYKGGRIRSQSSWKKDPISYSPNQSIQLAENENPFHMANGQVLDEVLEWAIDLQERQPKSDRKVVFRVAENMEEILQEHFQFSSFKNGQKEAIQNVLQHVSTLLILPTGKM